MTHQHTTTWKRPVNRLARTLLLATLLAPSAAWASDDVGVPSMVPPHVVRPERLTNPREPGSWPSLPAALRYAGAEGVFRVCVSASGTVNQIETRQAPDPRVLESWTEAIRRWRYRPLTVDGHSHSFCHTVRIDVRPER